MKWLTEHGFARTKHCWERPEVRVWRESAGRLWIAQDPTSGAWGQCKHPREAVVALAAALRDIAKARRAEAAKLDAAADVVEGVLR